MSINVSIIIPTYNGKELLDKYLPIVFHSLSNFKNDYEVIIVDDGSVDGTVEYVEKNFPQVRILSNKINQGFSKSCNKGILASNFEWVLVLNNDAYFDHNYLNELIEHVKADNIFSLSGTIYKPDSESIQDGGKCIEWKLGGFVATRNYYVTGNPNSEYYSFYNPAVACLYRKSFLFQLKGYDEEFSPYNGEDTDLCYRAWKRGMLSIYIPTAKAYHKPNTTITKFFKKRSISVISKRNKFLLHWKNLDSWNLWFKHIAFLCFGILTRWIIFDYIFYKSFLLAVKKIPGIIIYRRSVKEKIKIRDKELFILIRNSYNKSEVKLLFRRILWRCNS